MEFAELILSPKVDNVILRLPFDKTIEGTLCITGHHLIISSRKEGSEELWLLLRSIDYVERRPSVENNVLAGGVIMLKCKDLRMMSLEIRSPKEYNNVATSIEKLFALEHVEHQYPFFYRPMYSMLEDGYTIFRPEQEYAKLLAGEDWRITNLNKDFSVCPSYASVLVVPKAITDEQILQSAAYRDGGRFPILSYQHKNGAVLLRSSQPLVGPNIKRCRADEAILNTFLSRSTKGFIVDTWGKGKSNTETDQHYSQWKKVNRAIGDVSTPSSILDSFVKLMEACNDRTCTTEKWLSRLESSKWLNLVINSLNAACVVAQCLDQEGSPVLVHGAKGLDSTLIVTSLVQIILNPDCRSIRGLQALIDREWIQAGHPFHTRHRYSCYASSHNRPKTAGASFLLFLDCVFQLHYQFTCSFEFLTHMLVDLFEHSYFSQFGTFLCDSEKERCEVRLQERTTSLWSYLNRPEILDPYMNPLYDPNANVIWPSVSPISIEMWDELYSRWHNDQTDLKRYWEGIKELKQRENELRNRTIKLRQELIELDASNAKRIQALKDAGRWDENLLNALMKDMTLEEKKPPSHPLAQSEDEGHHSRDQPSTSSRS